MRTKCPLWIGAAISLLVGSACDDEPARLELPTRTPQGGGARNGPVPADRVAECDEAPSGTPCGQAGRDTHCIYDSCVRNECGDGIEAGTEECDDGDQLAGDGCSAICKVERCGNRIVDLGEACDDGQGGACADDCSGPRKLDDETPDDPDEPTDADGDAGTDEAPLEDPSCPRVTGATAQPGVAPVGTGIALTGVTTGPDAAGVAWLGPGGWFSAPDAETTLFVCEAPGSHELRFVVNDDACPPSGRRVVVECQAQPSSGGAGAAGGTSGGSDGSGGEGGPTGGIGGSGGDDADSGIDEQDADGGVEEGTDAGGSGDAGEAEGDGGEGAIPGLTEGCAECLSQSCRDYLGFDLYGPCFEGATGDDYSERCTPAFACSLGSADVCAFNAVRGPVGCYCGEHVTVDECQAGLVEGNCIAEWEVASSCEGTTELGDPSCVLGLFTDLYSPSGTANFMIECMINNCVDVCP